MTLCISKHDPLLAATLSVQEDLIVLEKKPDDSPVIRDNSVCFPSRWSPTVAAGKRVIDVHGIVPKFIAAGLEKSVNEILNKLDDAGIRFTRLVHPFSQLHQSAELGLMAAPQGVVYDKHNVGDLCFARAEKQRFFSGDYITGDSRFKDLLLMTIKTYVPPLKIVKASPSYAKSLLILHERFLTEAAAGQTKAHDVFVKYRGGTEAFIHPLIEYLSTIPEVEAISRRDLTELAVPSDIYSMPALLGS